MYGKKIVTGLKILVIVFLVFGISALAMIQWKSDAIVKRAFTLVQGQIEDSLKYERISLEWFRYFPSAALQLDGLHVGDMREPLIKGGHVDVVFRLFPLFNEKIIINKLRISGSQIHLTKNKGRWSYDIFKKAMQDTLVQKANASPPKSGSWDAMINKLEFENTTILYDDREGISLKLFVSGGDIDGLISRNLFDATLKFDASLEVFNSKSYQLRTPFAFELDGDYKYDMASGLQELKNWNVQNEGIDFEITGNIRKEQDHHIVDIHTEWSDANPDVIKALIPERKIKDWDAYVVSGKSKGEVEIKGVSSKVASPRIKMTSELKNGNIKFPGAGGQLKNMVLDLAYDSGDGKSKQVSYFRANLRNGSFEGNNLTADMRVDNLDRPQMSLSMKGALPAGILSLFMDPLVWNFKGGVFKIENYKISGLDIKSFSTKTFIDKSAGRLSAEEIHLLYNNDDIKISEGDMQLDDAGKMEIKAKEFIWNKAKGEKIEGLLQFSGDKIGFTVKGKHSNGIVTTKGVLTGLGNQPVLDADWIIEGIEMKELLASFENFDQTFITSEHLNGKADIWTHSTIPYDANGNIKQRDVVIRAAIDIKDGRLRNLKTLEDFSKYVHLDDLRDIRFNAFRNYMKIEDGKVYLPVMFLQSSAINISINGVHSFNQDILYNLKINAGQVAANKLKKSEAFKILKPARKSGWINLYFVLSGTVDNVSYEQDQRQVISSFEQSSQIKESLRKYLVDRFGHEVYWIEPNEWEDIPEYK